MEKEKRTLLYSPGECLTSLRARLMEHTHPDTYLPSLEASLVHWMLTHLRFEERELVELINTWKGFEWPSRQEHDHG